MGEYSFCRSSGHLIGHFSMLEDDDLGVLSPKGKSIGFEEMNQFSGISKSQLYSASICNCLAWFVVSVGWVSKGKVLHCFQPRIKSYLQK